VLLVAQLRDDGRRRTFELTLQPDILAMLTVGIILLVVWFLGFMLLRKVLGAVIHLLLIIAVVVIAWHFVGPMLK
jgi:ABC-type xylose transport system permease subunit